MVFPKARAHGNPGQAGRSAAGGSWLRAGGGTWLWADAAGGWRGGRVADGVGVCRAAGQGSLGCSRLERRHPGVVPGGGFIQVAANTHTSEHVCHILTEGKRQASDLLYLCYQRCVCVGRGRRHGWRATVHAAVRASEQT